MREVVFDISDMTKGDHFERIKTAKREGKIVYCRYNLNDIGATVKRAIDNLRELKVDFVSVHSCFFSFSTESQEQRDKMMRESVVQKINNEFYKIRI